MAHRHCSQSHVLGAAVAGSLVFGVGLGVALRTPSLGAWTSIGQAARGACSERVHDRLFFGLRRPGGLVTDAEWRSFLADVVTPRFPGGLTVVEASGQWSGDDRRPAHEPTRVVEIAYDENAGARGRVDEIVSAYKTRFAQQSVMVARARVEVCF